MNLYYLIVLTESRRTNSLMGKVTPER